MPKMIIIECSDEEADRMVEQLKNMVAEYEYHPYHGPGKLYEFGTLRIDQPKQEVTLDGAAVDLTRREFELLGLLAEHLNRALPAAFLHNAVWTHPRLGTRRRRSGGVYSCFAGKAEVGSAGFPLQDRR